MINSVTFAVKDTSGEQTTYLATIVSQKGFADEKTVEIVLDEKAHQQVESIIKDMLHLQV